MQLNKQEVSHVYIYEWRGNALFANAGKERGKLSKEAVIKVIVKTIKTREMRDFRESEGERARVM